jgi:cystathionine beta-lyase
MLVRLKHQEQAGYEVARWLQRRPEVARILHPGLPEDPGHAIWKRDFSGACSLFGVLFQPRYTEADIFRFVDGLKLFGIGASWGGYESLALPSGPAIARAIMPPLPGQAVRLHVGLEDVADLLADLEQGLSLLPR